jgi:hypothetical protein
VIFTLAALPRATSAPSARLRLAVTTHDNKLRVEENAGLATLATSVAKMSDGQTSGVRAAVLWHVLRSWREP